MRHIVRDQKMVREEIKIIKLYLVFFYTVFILYDIFYYYLYPKCAHGQVWFPENGLGVWFYFIIILFLPVVFILLKKGYPFAVKYVFTIGYIIVDTIDKFLIYQSNPNVFPSGFLVDLIVIMFTPIFINKRYYWTVICGIIGKYLLLSALLKQPVLLIPSVVLIVVAVISFILLTRFLSLIRAIAIAFDDLRQNEKLAYLGQMATAIGHEIRNPLSSLKGFTQLQQERDKCSGETNFYPIMIEEIDRINTIVDDLMILGKPRPPHFEEHDIEEIIHYVISVTNGLAKRSGVKIVIKKGEKLPQTECDDKQIKQALLNIIKNAIEAMQQGGTVEIAFTNESDENIKITIIDHGCGMEADKLQKLWEPFFTTKQEGTGLGLLVTKKIIDDHQGELHLESKIGEGTKVEIILPIKHRN